MSDSDRTLISKREKTMFVSFLISSVAPLITGITAIISRSATQIADFLRRTAELTSLFISWWVYRRLHKVGEPEMGPDHPYRVRMEYIANMTVFGAMVCSGIAMLVVGIGRLFTYKVSGSVIMGLAVATLGLLVNAWFWWRYSFMIREEFDPVIAGQQKLYRAKVFVDTAVVIALASVAVAPNHPAIKYIDALGCITVSAYLLYNGLGIIRKKVA
ncbi:MAG: cation transporter [Candidatus Alkaliphilus sp. MAG34]|nr:cation transporter [Clostridiales bacterium]